MSGGHWGTGVGQRLLDMSVGERDAFLWVFRDNARARSFYLRNGFRPDGAERVEPFFGPMEIRMVRFAACRDDGDVSPSNTAFAALPHSELRRHSLSRVLRAQQARPGLEAGCHRFPGQATYSVAGDTPDPVGAKFSGRYSMRQAQEAVSPSGSSKRASQVASRSIGTSNSGFRSTKARN